MSSSGETAGMRGAGLGAQVPTGTQLFEQIAAAAARRPTGLPPSGVAPGRWSGLLFLVGEWRLLAALARIDLVLALPSVLTPVPGTGRQVLGIANHQGALLPILDLGVLLGAAASVPGGAGRVLVVRRDGFPCGFLVSAVIASCHCDMSAPRAVPPNGPPLLASCVHEAFDLAGEVVSVLDLDRVAVAPLIGLG